MSVKQGSDPVQKKNFDKTFEDENKATNALVDIGTIQLTAEDLYDKDKVDLEQVHLEDVWKLLQSVSRLSG
jgi:H+-transporting ATPase